MKLCVKKHKKKIIFLIVLTISFTVPVMAKYFHNDEKNSLYEAENFYFNSDLLKETDINYNYKKGEDSITINISNNEDTLRYTEIDTNYEVTIKDLEGNSIKDKNNNTIEKVTGTLSGNSINNKNITFNNLKNGTYKVVATTTSPYKKTLEGTFTITNNEDALKYTVSDSAGSTVLYLTVTTTDYAGNIEITIPNNVYPDNNDSKIGNFDINKSKKITIDFKNNSEYSFKFFKENPNTVFSKNDFNVIAK